MKKLYKLIFSISLCAAALFSMHANSAFSQSSPGKSSRMTVGYTDESLTMELGSMLSLNVQGAIQLTKEDATRLKGAKITAVRFAVANGLTSQSNYIFITTDLNKPEFDYKQTVGDVKRGWNEFQLDEPFVIGSGDLFVGFKYTTAGDALSMDGRKDNDKANWLRFSEQEDDPNSSFAHQGGGNLNLQFIVEGENLPQYDAELRKVDARTYAQTNGKMPLMVYVKNNGAAEINSIEAKISIDNQTVGSVLADKLHVNSGKFALVDLGGVTFTRNGLHDLTVEITGINGNSDEFPDDNTGKVENIVSKSDYRLRNVLFEHFSTMKCANCPSADRSINMALSNRHGVIHVIHHTGYDADFLTLDASKALHWFYTDGANGSVYAPGGMLDRTNLSRYGASDGRSGSTPGPAFFPNRENIERLIDAQLNEPAHVELTMNSKFNESDRTLTAELTALLPTKDAGKYSKYTGDDTRFHLFITEDNIEGTQAAAHDPEHFTHNHAVRAFVTPQWGDKIDFIDGKASKTYQYIIPGEWKDKDIKIIAFVSNFTEGNPNNCKVYNSTVAQLAANGGAGIQDLTMESQPLVVSYDNGLLRFDRNISQITVTDISGQTIKVIKKPVQHTDVSDLPDGIYIAKFVSNGMTKSLKFVKNK